MPPEQAIMLGVFKAVEVELLSRNLLGQAGRFATPLWFIAETERNVFLWRSGKSLDDRNMYSFWIDLEALIDKRRLQIGRSNTFNPFTNISPSAAGIDLELRYLDRLEALLEAIITNASAISRASLSATREVLAGVPNREIVLLPCTGTAIGGRSTK
jgi:hypothetical protein